MCNGYCYQDSNFLDFVSLSNVDSEIHWLFTRWYMLKWVLMQFNIWRNLLRTFSISCSLGRTLQIINVTTWMWQNTSTDQTQTLLAIGTSYVQGEDVAAKGRIILVSVGQDPQDPSSWVRTFTPLRCKFMCCFLWRSCKTAKVSCISFANLIQKLNFHCSTILLTAMHFQHIMALYVVIVCHMLWIQFITCQWWSLKLHSSKSHLFLITFTVTSFHTIDVDDFNY